MSSKPDFNIDLIQFPYVIVLFIVFVVSRIPFIDLGFSVFTSQTDQDVLAVVNSAYLLRHEHVYTVSRFPGYPFFETINAAFIDGGWVATNTATMIVSFICILIFAKILNKFKVRNKALLVLTFTFIPVVWINSVVTMDYMWSLMFVLSASYLAFSGNYTLAGIATGFAVANRFTSIFMVIPVLYLALARKENKREMVKFSGTTIVTSVLFFIPVFSRYGLDFLQGSGFIDTTPINKPATLAIQVMGSSFYDMIVELFGITAFLLLIIFLILNSKNRQVPVENRDLMNFSLLTILIFVILYFIFPYKVAYLIPVVPWGLIAINGKLRKTSTLIICILLLFNGIVSIQASDDGNAQITITKGPVIQDYEDRKSESVDISKEYIESLSILLDYEK